MKITSTLIVGLALGLSAAAAYQFLSSGDDRIQVGSNLNDLSPLESFRRLEGAEIPAEVLPEDSILETPDAPYPSSGDFVAPTRSLETSRLQLAPEMVEPLTNSGIDPLRARASSMESSPARANESASVSAGPVPKLEAPTNRSNQQVSVHGPAAPREMDPSASPEAPSFLSTKSASSATQLPSSVDAPSDTIESQPAATQAPVQRGWRPNPFLDKASDAPRNLPGPAIPQTVPRDAPGTSIMPQEPAVRETPESSGAPQLQPPVATGVIPLPNATSSVGARSIDPAVAGATPSHQTVQRVSLEKPAEPQPAFTSSGGDFGSPTLPKPDWNTGIKGSRPLPANVADVPTSATAGKFPTRPTPTGFQTRVVQLSPQSALQAIHQVEYGKTLSRRGALMSARQEFLGALQGLAEANDAATGTTNHTSALRQALSLLQEADDFRAANAEEQIQSDVARIAEHHQANLLTGDDASQLTSSAAIQRYLTVAQDQLDLAGGRNPVAGEAFYCLGKLHSLLAKQKPGNRVMDTARAILYHQAALLSEPNHHLSANELGVLLAKSGQLEHAKQMLHRSLAASPTQQAWRNLAVVHQRSGEVQLAQLAVQESQRIGERQPDGVNDSIQWMSTQQFNAEAPLEVQGRPAAMPASFESPVASPSNHSPAKSPSLAERIKQIF